MTSRAKIQLGVHWLIEFLPTFRAKLGTSIWHALLWNVMWAYDLRHVKFNKFCSGVCCLYWDKVGDLCQTNHYDPYRVISNRVIVWSSPFWFPPISILGSSRVVVILQVSSVLTLLSSRCCIVNHISQCLASFHTTNIQSSGHGTSWYS
jgi:hypothetical protein